MRCKICDKDSDTVTLHEDCSECQEAIYECLMGYDKSDDEALLDEEFDLVAG